MLLLYKKDIKPKTFSIKVSNNKINTEKLFKYKNEEDIGE